MEGIHLHQQRYPWEGSDMDYLYDEVSISLDGLRFIFESRQFEITKLAMCQDSKSISADEGIMQSILMMRKMWRELICTSNGTRGREVTWITYTTSFNMPKSQCSGCCKAQAGNICVAAFDSTCSGICRSADPIVELAPFDLTKKKKKTFVVQDAIEDSAESHGRHTIRCLIVQEEFIGYIAEHPNDEEEVEGIDLHQQRYPWDRSEMDYLYDEAQAGNICVVAFDSTCSSICRSADPIVELAPFDLTKKKKKTFVVHDAIKDSAESHGRHTICCLIVQEEFIGYIAEHLNDEEEVEGIYMHQQRYPWEGSDMDYLYDEVSISLDGLWSIFERRRFEITKLAMCQDNKSISVDGNICVAAFDSTCSGICRSADPIVEFIYGSQEVKEEEAKHPNDEEEVEGIDLHQQCYPWEGSDMDYLYDEVSISLDGLRSIFESRRFEITKLAMCQDIKSISADGNIGVAAFDSTCNGICRSVDPIVERHKFEPYRGYIAEHPNDEEEVEGIDMHQQRYPWEGSDMGCLYDESSFAHLLSMELTLEIDGAIFHVPNANASSNVDSLSFNMPKSQCSGCCKIVNERHKQGTYV
ncbi:hypothetical protein DY000_02028800 [Brassica cretica]|uniref:Uncharacterized protein n=1 Tax=Brassica cretica TaxID=69181 RepID=A0ABQ7DI92_BRACR|nr:hypothetical protein DY000_02028800 [Brassica cretica]